MSLLEAATAAFPDAVISTHSNFGDDTVTVRKENIFSICEALRNRPEFDFDYLIDITAVDNHELGESSRFTVVYHLYSLSKNHRIRLKVPVDEVNLQVDSVTRIWPAANWLEREVWDMFGIQFTGHPNPKRLLMYEGFVGHPLRKDYPYRKRQPLIGPMN